jgi:hypothetical protein
MAVSLLAVAVTNGFVKEYRGRFCDLVDCAILWAERGSERAADALHWGASSREPGDLNQVVRAQLSMARAHSNLARHQAEMVRVQVEGIRARVMEHELHSVITSPGRSFVIAVPQPPQIFEHDAF